MRIAITGPQRKEAIIKAERTFNTIVKTPWEQTIIDSAAETYKYFNEQNVVFEGSPFDFLAKNPGEGYDDVYEQIAINSLSNIDYIAVITMDMNKDELKVYEEYEKLFPGKIYFYNSSVEFDVRLR